MCENSVSVYAIVADATNYTFIAIHVFASVLFSCVAMRAIQTYKMNMYWIDGCTCVLPATLCICDGIVSFGCDVSVCA